MGGGGGGIHIGVAAGPGEFFFGTTFNFTGSLWTKMFLRTHSRYRHGNDLDE